MVSSQQTNQKLPLDYDNGDLTKTQQSDNPREIFCLPSGITSNLPFSVSSVTSIPVSVSPGSITFQGTSNKTQPSGPNISNEGPMQPIDLRESEDVNVKRDNKASSEFTLKFSGRFKNSQSF